MRLEKRMSRSAHRPAPSRPTHRRRGVVRAFARLRRRGTSVAAAFLAVLGPGLLAGLSDDDPAGITTYALLGTDFGYRLLWVIPAATLLLTYFHLLAVEVGTATGRGFVALVRERWGRGAGYAAAVGLLFANFGTICAEYAGIAAAAGLVGIPPWISAPLSGILISLVVVLGSFRRIEGLLLAVSATLSLYLVDGVIARPDWGLVAWHTGVPHLPLDHRGWVALAATVGTTLAPWGLAFIQSYAVDKRLRSDDLPLERVEVVAGSLLTGLIGLAIAVACAATLHQAGIAADSADDVAVSLEPLAGRFATQLFGGGLLGAAVLAAAVVPIATAYSVAEGIGAPASLALDGHRFHVFYAVFVGLTVAAVSVVAIPGLPLFPLMVATQVVNAVLLPLQVVALLVLARGLVVAGRPAIGPGTMLVGWLGVAAVVACVIALAASWIGASSGAAGPVVGSRLPVPHRRTFAAASCRRSLDAALASPSWLRSTRDAGSRGTGSPPR